MPDKRNDEQRPAPAKTGPRAKKCRTCRQDVPGALVHGECADCAGLIPLPLRGAGGRFMTFTQPATAPRPASGPAESCTRDGVTVRRVPNRGEK